MGDIRHYHIEGAAKALYDYDATIGAQEGKFCPSWPFVHERVQMKYKERAKIAIKIYVDNAG